MEAALAAMWLGIGYLAGLFMAPSDADASKRALEAAQAEIAILRAELAQLRARYTYPGQSPPEG